MRFRPMQIRSVYSASPWCMPHLMLICTIGFELVSSIFPLSSWWRLLVSCWRCTVSCTLQSSVAYRLSCSQSRQHTGLVCLVISSRATVMSSSSWCLFWQLIYFSLCCLDLCFKIKVEKEAGSYPCDTRVHNQRQGNWNQTEYNWVQQKTTKNKISLF